MAEEELGWTRGVRWVLVNEPSHSCPWGKLLSLL